MLRHSVHDHQRLRTGLRSALTRRPALVAAAALALALAVPACSSDSGGGGETPGGGGLELVDFRFRPDAITVTGGGQVTIRVTNAGSVTHNVTIPAINAGVDYEPGRTSNLIFVAPASGPIEFYCKFHRDRGMTGAFILRR